MKIPTLFIFAFLTLTASFAQAEPLLPPPPHILEKSYEFKATPSGKKKARQRMLNPNRYSGTARVEIIKFEREGNWFYQIKQNKELNNGQSLEITTLIEIGEVFKSISNHRIRRNQAGKEIENATCRFDHPSWEYPDDMYCFEVLGPIVLPSLFFQPGDKGSFHIWRNDDSVIRMLYKKIGTEMITTPIGDLPHMKVSLAPDIRTLFPIPDFLASLVQVFVPKFYFWFWEKEGKTSSRFQASFGWKGYGLIAESFQGD